MDEKRKDDENPIVIYTSQDGQVHVNVRIEGETAWLTQAAMAQLFGCTAENVIMHLKNIYAEGELQDSATTKDFLVVRLEGSRQVSRQIKHYNLDAIIAVGYRVNSARATRNRVTEKGNGCHKEKSHPRRLTHPLRRCIIMSIEHNAVKT